MEQPALELLAALGWEVLSGFDEPTELGRPSKADVVLGARLRDAVVRLNLGLDAVSYTHLTLPTSDLV